jgi:AhpD family alkylhydroperoxidase
MLILNIYTTSINVKEAMSEYQRPDDFAQAKELMRLAPKEAQAFMNLKATAERSDGAIPEKYRELISIAVALTTQCSYCIDAHTKNAVKAGATREEIAETVFIAAALRAGAAVGHGLLALRLFDEASS